MINRRNFLVNLVYWRFLPFIPKLKSFCKIKIWNINLNRLF